MDIIILVIALLSNLLLGLFVLLRNPKSATNYLFFLFNLDVALWSLSNFFSLRVSNDEILFWMRLVMLFAVPQAVLFFLLIHTLPSTKIRLKKRYLYPLIFFSILTMLITMTPLLFSKVEFNNGVATPIVAPGMIIFIMVTIGSLLLGFYTLFRKLRYAKGIERVQLFNILIGILIMFVLVVTLNFVLVVFFNNLSFIFLSPLYTFPFSISLAYSIIKHRFLDIRLVVARAVAYIILIAFIGLSYSAILINMAIILGSKLSQTITIITSTLLALIFAISFQPLRRFFERITDKIFYKDRYDAQELLWSLSRIMASTLDLSHLTQRILDRLLTDMKISYGSIVLVRNTSVIWVGSAGKTIGHPFRGAEISQLIQQSYKPHTKAEQLLMYEEMSDSPIKTVMRGNEITIVLPLVVRQELIGGMLLGQKSSGEIYSSEDIDVLKIIAPEIAVAVKNALSFEEIKRFNVTLEEEVHHATATLRRANSRLKELDNLKDEFVSIASHELRTPMTAIKSYLWMALNEPGQKIKDPLAQYLKVSYNSTERLIRLVNEMLTVSRIERKKIELKKENVDVFDIVQQVYDELKMTAQERKIRFSIKGKENAPYQGYGDKDKLREVFQNIVGNALKFTSADGEIQIAAEKDTSSVRIAISDTGPGIPKESMKDLFKKFSKIEYSYAKHSNQPGTGLGLYISKQIVSLHGGDIQVESEVNVGSTFTVILPAVRKRKEAESK